MVTIKDIPDRFSKSERKVYPVTYRDNTQLADYLAGYDIADRIVLLNGKPVTDLSLPVPDNSEILIVPRIQGSFIAGLVSFIVTAAYVTLVVASIASIPYAIYAMVTSKPRKASRGLADTGGIEDGSPTYGWSGIQITSEPGIPIGVVAGKHRIGGNIINQYLSTDGDKNYLNILIALGEGELASIDDVQVDGNPIDNYQGVEIHKRFGTADQDAIGYFHQVHHVTDIGVQITQGNSYTYTTTLDDITAFELYLECPNGLFLYNMYNQLREMNLTYTVEYKLSTSSDWISLGEQTFLGKTRSALRRTFRKENLTPGRYDIRVTKISLDSSLEQDSWTVTSDFQFNSIDEIQDDLRSYPHTALLGLRLLATEQLSGAVPNITCLVKRKFLQPRIMNGDQEVAWEDYYWDPDYDGTGAYRLFADDTVLSWDGDSYIEKYCSNPIWIMRNLITNTRYGLGEYIASDIVDLNYALEESKYAEEKVEDGNGGYEKRFQLNAVLDASSKALDVIVQFSAAFRGLPFYSDGKIFIKIDKPEYPVFTYGMGNIIEDSMTESWMAKSEAPNEIEIQFANEDNEYKQESVFIQDDDSINRGDPRRKKVLRILCTKLSCAIREGRYAMRLARYLDRTITFKTGMASIVCQAGDVINFAHDVPQIGFSGRVKNGTLLSVTLDQTVVIEPDKIYHVIVQFSDDSQEERTVINEPGTCSVLTVSENFSQTPQKYDIYSFGEVNKVVEPFRIVDMKRQADGEVEIEAIKYDESVYDDSGLTLPVLTYSSLRADVPVVSNVVLSEELVIAKDGTIEVKLDVWFQLPVNPGQHYIRRYDFSRIYVSANGGISWEYRGDTRDAHFSIIGGVQDGMEYTVAVVSVSADGESNPVPSSPQASIVIAGKTLPPSDITGFEVSQIGTNIKFLWNVPPDLDFAFVRIKKGNDWSTADTILERGDINEITVPVTEIGSHTYLCKAVDTSGNESENPVSDTIDIRLLDTSQFIKDCRLLDFSDFLRFSNVDAVYRSDTAGICAQKLFCLTTSQTWEDFESLGYNWSDISIDFDALAVEASGYIEMAVPVDLGVITKFFVYPDPEYTGSANTSLEIQISISDNGTTYTAFSALTVGVYRARYVKFRIVLTTSNNLENIFLRNIYFLFESPDTKRAYGRDVAVSSSGTTVLYGDTFIDTPTVNVTIVDGTVGIPVITSKSLISFDVIIYNLSGNPVDGEIDWFASGV